MQADHVPHSIFIKPLRAFDIWPENPNNPITTSGDINKIDLINTYDDWHIVPLSRPIVKPPVFKENYLDLPGVYGSLDYSRAHMGIPIYGNRTGQWEFVVLNDFRSWEEAYSDIQHTIHGRRCFVTLEDDPDYYYAGTLKLNEWRSDPGWSRIVIDYTLDPFKYSVIKTQLTDTLTSQPNVGFNLTPELLGREPVHPWVKITPENTDDLVEINLLYTNLELQITRTIKLSTTNIFVAMPEFLLSNESGTNEAALVFSKNEDVEYEGEVGIEVVYTRRYM